MNVSPKGTCSGCSSSTIHDFLANGICVLCDYLYAPVRYARPDGGEPVTLSLASIYLEFKIWFIEFI